jgi:hypothetical protein
VGVLDAARRVLDLDLSLIHLASALQSISVYVRYHTLDGEWVTVAEHGIAPGKRRIIRDGRRRS